MRMPRPWLLEKHSQLPAIAQQDVKRVATMRRADYPIVIHRTGMDRDEAPVEVMGAG